MPLTIQKMALKSRRNFEEKCHEDYRTQNPTLNALNSLILFKKLKIGKIILFFVPWWSLWLIFCKKQKN
jgi:hypothetical protein